MTAIDLAIKELDAFWARHTFPAHDTMTRIHLALDDANEEFGPFEPSGWKGLLEDALRCEGFAVTFEGEKITALAEPTAPR